MDDASADAKHEVRYLYRDAGQLRVPWQLRRAGSLDIEALRPFLFDKEWFVPERVGLLRSGLARPMRTITCSTNSRRSFPTPDPSRASRPTSWRSGSARSARARHGSGACGGVSRRGWTQPEIVAAVELYLRTPFGRIDQRNPEIADLARRLDRTSGAVALKMANLASLDTTLDRRGMANASALDRRVWAEPV